MPWGPPSAGGAARSGLLRSSRPLAVVACVAALLAVTVPAAAARLAAASSSLVAGRAEVAGCGSLAAAKVSYSVTANAVTAVTVSGLPTGCSGGTLKLALLSGSTPAAQGGPVTVAGTTATITGLSASVAPATITSVSLVVTQ